MQKDWKARTLNLILENKEAWIALEKSGPYFPGPRKPSRTTLWRWAFEGKLETVTQGKFRYTSEEAIARFVLANNTSQPEVPQLTEGQRRRQGEAANRALEAAGI